MSTTTGHRETLCGTFINQTQRSHNNNNNNKMMMIRSDF